MGTAVYSIILVIAVGGFLYGGMVLVAKTSPRSARLTSRNARRACAVLPDPSNEAVGYARGFSGDISTSILVAYLLAVQVFLLPLLLFFRRHPPVELVATRDEMFVVRHRHPLLGGRARLLQRRTGRSELVVVKRWRHGAAVVALGAERFLLFPGHLDALVGAERVNVD